MIGLIRASDFAQKALHDAKPQGFDIELRDETVADTPVLMYAQRSSADADSVERDLRHMEVLDVPGRRWVLRVTATPEFARINGDHRADFVLAGGLALSLILSANLFGILRRKARGWGGNCWRRRSAWQPSRGCRAIWRRSRPVA